MKLKDVEHILEEFPGAEVANINSDAQVVVGGRKGVLEKLNTYLRQKRIKGILLNVSGPFHTSLMKEAGDLLAPELEKLDFKDPELPVYLNYSGEKALDRQEIKRGLVEQISSPVRWVDIVNNIANGGIEIFVEIGPKKVIRKIVEGILPGVSVFNVEDKGSLEMLKENLDK